MHHLFYPLFGEIINVGFFSEHCFVLIRLIFYLNTLQMYKWFFLYFCINKNKYKNGKFIHMFNFAENFTSSSIPGVDLEIQFINSVTFLWATLSPNCCQPCQCLLAHCPPPYLCDQFPILLWTVSQIHHCFIYISVTFYINNKAIASYLASYPII